MIILVIVVSKWFNSKRYIIYYIWRKGYYFQQPNHQQIQQRSISYGAHQLNNFDDKVITLQLGEEFTNGNSNKFNNRYRRQDAIGTPFCVTVDHQTAVDKTVTIRFRDTMLQERVDITKLRELILDKVNFRKLFSQLK